MAFFEKRRLYQMDSLGQGNDDIACRRSDHSDAETFQGQLKKLIESLMPEGVDLTKVPKDRFEALINALNETLLDEIKRNGGELPENSEDTISLICAFLTSGDLGAAAAISNVTAALKPQSDQFFDAHLFGDIELGVDNTAHVPPDAPINNYYDMPFGSWVVKVEQNPRSENMHITYSSNGFLREFDVNSNPTEDEIVTAIRGNTARYSFDHEHSPPLSQSIHFEENDPIQTCLPKGIRLRSLEFPQLMFDQFDPSKDQTGRLIYKEGNGSIKNLRIKLPGGDRDPYKTILALLEDDLSPELFFTDYSPQAIDYLLSNNADASALLNNPPVKSSLLTFFQTPEAALMLKGIGVSDTTPLGIANYMEEKGLTVPQFLKKLPLQQIPEILKKYGDTRWVQALQNAFLQERDKMMAR